MHHFRQHLQDLAAAVAMTAFVIGIYMLAAGISVEIVVRRVAG